MSTPVQSSNVPLQISFDNGVTWKDLVCMQNYAIESTTQTTTEDTFCARYIGIGVIATQITGAAVCDVAPSNTQVSIFALKAAQAAAQLINIRANYPTAGSAGGAISNNGQGYITAAAEQMAVNNLVKFTFTILVNGSFL